MNTVAKTANPLLSTALLERARTVVGVAVVWGALALALGHIFPAHPHDDPVVLVGGVAPLYAPVLFIAIVWASAAVAVLIAGRPSPRRTVLLAAWGVGLWAAFGGTIDAWLAHVNVEPSPPRALPYWLLIGDMLVLGGVFAGVALIGAWLGRFQESAHAEEWRGARKHVSSGLATSVVIALVTLAVSYVLMGPATADTRRGQVIFAMGVGFAVGVLAARQILGPQPMVWSWLAVTLVGLGGLVVAGFSPAFALPEVYDHLNIKPAWWAVRPLPMELYAIGLIAVSWSRHWTRVSS